MKFHRDLTKSIMYCHLEANVKCLLHIIFLHYNGIVNDVKMQGMFKSLRSGKLYRNTFHCTINDKWYHDEHMNEIYDDVFISMVESPVKNEISFDELLKYIRLYLNKNKNYCINYIFGSIISPVINAYQEYNNFNTNFTRLLGIVEPELNIKRYEDCHDLDWGYCCDDCDGDLNAYKRSRYEYNYVRENKKQINEHLKTYLNSKRNKTPLPAPEFKIFY